MLRSRITVLVVVVVVAAAAVIAYVATRQDTTTYSAMFQRTTGLYVGDDVQILGVKVGSIESIHPEGAVVEVEFSVRSDQPLPADAKAAIVAPSLVTARFLQVAPVYTGGPKLPSNAPIPVSRTAVPVEWDQVKQQLATLAKALGPNGVNKTGAASRLVSTAYANLHGSAEQLHELIGSLAQSSTTLADGSGNLFATVRNLQSLVQTLSQDDSSLRSFSGQLVGVSTTLAESRTDLATALDTLDNAMAKVTAFVRTNRSGLKAGVSKLATLSRTLSDERGQIADILHIAPTALSNFYNIIDPRYNAVTGRISADNFQDAAGLVCGSITSLGGSVNDCKSELAPLIKLLGLDKLPVPGVPVGGVPSTATTPATGGTSTTTNPVQQTLNNVTGVTNGLLNILVPGGK